MMAEDQGPIVGDGRSRWTEGRGTETAAGRIFLEARVRFSSRCREADGAAVEGESRADASPHEKELDLRLVTQCKGDEVHAEAQDSWRNSGAGANGAAAVSVVRIVMMPGREDFS